jgi:hypothetical protein
MYTNNRRHGGPATNPVRLVLPLTLALGLVACDDFLPTEPKGQLTTENFFETSEQAEQATNATYAMLRNWSVHVFSWIGMTDIVSDDATKGSVPADAGFLLDIDNLVFDPGNIAFSGTWQGYYQGIYRANVALQNIPDVSMDASLQERLIGENKFLRGYYYFFLVRAFGGVPLITAPLRPGEYFQPRATAEEVYALIEQDLTEAIAVLPEQYDGANLGRATRGAAQALLARVHLYQGEYDLALEQAQAVIDSGIYALYPDYAELFRPVGENSSEAVFEAQAVALEGGNNGASGGASQYAQVQGVRGTPNLGWGFNTPSTNLEASFEPGDPRLGATVMYPWETLPDGSGIVYLNSSMPNNRYNQKVFLPEDNPGGTGNGGLNIRLIRYADVLLTAAEAAQGAGNEGQARTWLNMVRARARGGMDVTVGFQAEALSPEIASDMLDLATPSRVFVRFVGEDTDAYAAGLRGFSSAVASGAAPLPLRVVNLDVVTAVDGTPVTDMASYRSAVGSLGAGGTATLDVTRVTQAEGGAPSTTTMTVDVPVLPLLPDVTAGGQELLEAIWTERRHELAMEQHRWFDLVRQGRAGELLGALTCQERALPSGCAPIVFREGVNELYPIPSGEITIAGLTQNPGY